MIARTKHKERAKETLRGKMSGMIGMNALTAFFNSACLATVMAGVTVIMVAVVAVVSVLGVAAGISSAFRSLGFGSGINGILAGFTIVYSISLMVLGILARIIGILTGALSGVVDFGNKRYYMQIAKTGKAPGAVTVMDGFHDFLGVFWVYLNRLIIIFLWQLPWILGQTLLGMIPVAGFLLGIICMIGSVITYWYKHYEYWAVPYIKADIVNIDAVSCMKLSKQFCHDHIVDLLVLDLSFLGWSILNNISVGLVGFFYYTPYLRQTEAYVYQELKKSSLEICPVTDLPPAGVSLDEVQKAIEDAFNIRKKSGGKEEESVGMVGLSGMYINVPFVFKPNETVIIGRDANQCNIIISTGGEQVSHKHCSIRFVSTTGEYEVIDYSSNGVLANGKKIPAKVPVSLPHGTTISLANNKNSFRLL